MYKTIPKVEEKTFENTDSTLNDEIEILNEAEEGPSEKVLETGENVL